MLRHWIATIILSFACLSACAYEFNGTITPKGNGRYVVSVTNDDGDRFGGSAVDQGDGTIYVTVIDNNGVKYSGIATDFADGDYQVELKDETTGDIVTGTLSQE